jgi:hypothetical protein
VAVDTARAQHKVFILALVLPKISENPGPSWMALRVVQRGGRGDQRAGP